MLAVAGANMNAESTDLHTPLMFVIIMKHLSIIELIVNSGADVNYRTGSGLASLHMAIMLGNDAILSKLIELGADINAFVTDTSITPLKLAVANGVVKIVEVLINAGCIIEIDGEEDDLERNTYSALLHFAIMFEQNEMVTFLKAKGSDVNKEFVGITPLYYAVEDGHTSIISTLLDAGANMNAKCNGLSILNIAIIYENVEAVEVLVNKGCNLGINTDLVIPLLHAVYKGNIEIINILLNAGCDKDIAEAQNGYTALHIAAGAGNDEVLDILLNKGCNIYALNLDQQTPKDLALAVGYNEVAEFIDEWIQAHPEANAIELNNENPDPNEPELLGEQDSESDGE